jgi:TolB-like protein
MVVLPFANIGGDLEQEHFVDGVAESLTTDLSRIRGAVMIARNTAFTYKGKPLDVKTIGRELNVRYVLEGSVQRGGNRMRVNVQLIDAESGNHLWAERFDEPLADLLDMQDEIVARLANALDAQLIDAEANPSWPPARRVPWSATQPARRHVSPGWQAARSRQDRRRKPARQSMRPSQDQPPRPMTIVFLGEHSDDASVHPRAVHDVLDLGLARLEMPLSSML